MATSNSAIFNNPKYSDVILHFGDRQIYAHKVVLCMWSPFFERTFNSKFPVAESNVFIVDSDDKEDYVPLLAMLKHVYGMGFGDHCDNDCSLWDNNTDLLNHSIRVYMLADKYDVPSCRRAVISAVKAFFEPSELSKEWYTHLRSDIPNLPDYVARICGPDAPQLADPSLRTCVFEWLLGNFGHVGEDPGFYTKLEDGSLLDADMTTKLLLTLSARIRHFSIARDTGDITMRRRSTIGLEVMDTRHASDDKQPRDKTYIEKH